MNVTSEGRESSIVKTVDSKVDPICFLIYQNLILTMFQLVKISSGVFSAHQKINLGEIQLAK